MSSSVLVHRIGFEMPEPPGVAYAYLVGTDEPLLVDAGTMGEEGWAELVGGLRTAGFEPEDIEHVLVTHPHTDHAGQVARLIDVSDPTVYAPVGVRKRLARNPEDLADVVRSNAIEMGIPDPAPAVEKAVNSLTRNRGFLPPEEIDVDVPFGEPFEAGEITFEAIHAPGHQANQAAFYDGGRLFAGDALAKPFRTAALHAGFDRGCTNAIDAFYTGRDRLASREIDRVYPGHGPIFDDAETAIERDRKDLDDLLASCREVLVDLGSATAYEVTKARIDDVDQFGFSIFESVGALARLDRLDSIDSSLDDDVRYYRA